MTTDDKDDDNDDDACVGSLHLLNDSNVQHQQPQPQQQQLQLSDVNVDDWEIDPRHVTLGVEIGQGAFGRVLTGFYHNQQIAIKVLKGMPHTIDRYLASYGL